MKDDPTRSKTKAGLTEARQVAIWSFLLIAIVVVLSKLFLDVGGESMMLTLILVPAVLFLLFSGRLKEFKGPGGVEAKFQDFAGEVVKPASETVEASVDEIQVVMKEGRLCKNSVID